MSNQSYSPEFKYEVVRQVVERGYTVREVAHRLGVSQHWLYKWAKNVKPDESEQHAQELVEAKCEVLKPRAERRSTQEERDILKKAAAYFAREPE